MIYYNLNTINDWNFGDDNIIKVYRNGAVVFYKFDSEQGGYKVCYAVVDDITQYSETEFEDVYDKATEKWFKLNNLNQYEEYGIYGSGRTSCEGSTSRLPQGYTEVEYIENTGTSTSNGAYINSGLKLYDTVGNSFSISGKVKSEYYAATGYDDLETIINSESVSSPYYGFVYRYAHSSHILEFTNNPSGEASFSSTANTDGTTSITISCNSTSVTDQVPLGLFASYNANYSTPYRFAKATIYSLAVVKNGTTVRDFVPCQRNSDSVYGLYDLITDTFYTSPNGNNFIGGEPVTPTGCVTTYNGKLTIDDGYEHEWNGSSWVNLGEVSGSSRVPAGYTEVEYIQNTGHSYIDTNFVPNQDTRIVADMQLVTLTDYPRLLGAGAWNSATGINLNYEGGYLQIGWFGSTTWTKFTSVPTNYDRKVYDLNKNYLYVDETLVGSTTYASRTASDHLAIFTYIASGRPSSTQYWNGEFFKGKMYSFKVYDNGTLVRDLVPCKRDNDNTVGAYDIVNDVFYTVPTGYTTDKLIAGAETGATEYPKYYSEKSEPLDNITFNTLAEAQTYAEANCVYDGMKATIGADRYYFDSTDENGWVKVTEYYIVEDVTPNAASGWTITGSSTYNPQPSYYDDFSVALNSSYQTKVAKVTIYGYENFTYYLRSTGYSSYAYATSSNVDELTSDPTSMSYSSSSAITNTYNFNKAAGSAVNLSNYRRVTYNNLDKTVEHTFYVVFYDGYYYSSYPPSATILIPKEQTNENWEQVTFSASSNVASAQKSLYIDGNSSTSGGTNFFYHRWIVGLPSGGHSSYTNNSFYDYCPNVTSSTFTSVAGEQRQVNFTYDYVSNKGLTFRLTDGNGNELTPTNTIYYNMVVYNSCGTSETRSNLTFPRYLTVKVGGSFYFSNSSNKHYIYGYQPPTLETMYYADNYQDTFDITYTKLSDEAVTITYTTYDPSDVETPAFKTDITYPYSGGTTSSTTLTSYDVPYTYPYTVSQTSDKFSATSQTYTANQAARTINFVLYPNNREFASVADLEAYAYAWEGMKATVGDTKYKYENGEWVENQHSLPDVPFVLNYNAKQYNASTHSIPMTSGQLNDTDAVAYNNPNNIVDHSADGYITISNSSMRIRKQGQDISLFNRSSNSTSSDLTIVCKAKSTSGENIITNRDSNYNWMYRLKTSGILRFHGVSETGSISWNTSNPDIMSVRTYYSSGTKLKYNNWTQNTSTSPTSFTYGSTNSDGGYAGALFVGYGWNYTSEQWSGDFYWVYMAQANLTDEQVQQVIDYNENL